ncbi:MAG: helix-turn-helix transcriptional regulator [Clostridiaceae bacterium]|jgi:transcriptional regulator with XRE-family HTH domain|nr:helix-turn-helix transcriptional regulator [Clostridiaceae bacterium]
MSKYKILTSAWDFIDGLSSEETKESFELYDILYYISMQIFDYRMNRGLTQKQLAEKLNVKQSMISKLESGEYNPTIEQLWRVSKKLDWLFSIKFEEKVSNETNVWNMSNISEEEGSGYLPDLAVSA